MILLDTNVVSELMRRKPDLRVIRWIDAQPRTTIWTTTITIFEIRLGLERMPNGRRRRALEEAFSESLIHDFEQRIAAFDQPAADAAGRLYAARLSAGRPIDFRDVQIAGIALARNSPLATRNARHFADIDVELIDPWGA